MMTAPDRFWAKITLGAGCWEWSGALRSGYGWFNTGRKPVLAHRYSWFLATGQEAGDLCVCHHCDNRLCVRHDHLFLGTRADNNHDMHSKGRGACGERVKGAKLTRQQAHEIRELYCSGAGSQRDIAARYGVTQTNVQAIVSGRSWSAA